MVVYLAKGIFQERIGKIEQAIIETLTYLSGLNMFDEKKIKQIKELSQSFESNFKELKKLAEEF